MSLIITFLLACSWRKAEDCIAVTGLQGTIAQKFSFKPFPKGSRFWKVNEMESLKLFFFSEMEKTKQLAVKQGSPCYNLYYIHSEVQLLWVLP